ncbi:unnamed protein product [Dracunculus medinensis]|uniref:Uncharacterized protein n=1 Tax=Dracunculus medinensis TaxID=318479 RepID=A0A0N4U8F8_DRAME|nr:unnamed protein product [Dracunculus medinensis]
MTSTMGKYGIGEQCANREHLLRYAEELELFVTKICFRHCRKHLIIPRIFWDSPDSQHFNQIDYILVTSSLKSSPPDSRIATLKQR